jgi:hypothetical protein
VVLTSHCVAVRKSLVLVGLIFMLLPAIADAAPRVVAKVREAKCDASTCNAAFVSRRRYVHWLPIFRRQSSDTSEEVGVAYGLRWQIVQFLLRDAWIAAEVGRLRLDDVTPEQVKAEVERIRHQEYASDAEFEQFLRESGQTYSDLEWRARMFLRANAIEAHVMAPAGHDAQEAERLRVRHARRFIKHWRERTTCARRYRIKDCRNYKG